MIKKLAATFVAAGALLVFAAPAAQAAPPEPFTITEHFTLTPGGINRFEATGALCPSGIFVDVIRAGGGAHSKFNFLVDTTYTCDKGDTFFAQKHLHLVFEDELNFKNTGGPITLKGGTGAFTRLSGHGVDSGTVEDGVGVANIPGVLKVR